MRIQRALALAGIASRRAAERMVEEGRVRVNGVPATIGQSVGPDDRIEVDGRLVGREEAKATYLLNKARGVVSTASDPQGRPTVIDAVPSDVRLYPVGRLDFDTSGALLMTNDGELAHRLMHPRSGVPKVYEALVGGHVSEESVARLRDGVELEDGPTNPAKVEIVQHRERSTLLRIELTEGRNRQVRRMCEAVGHRVRRLARVRYDGLDLRGLPPGSYRPLKREEISALGALVGLER